MRAIRDEALLRDGAELWAYTRLRCGSRKGRGRRGLLLLLLIRGGFNDAHHRHERVRRQLLIAHIILRHEGPEGREPHARGRVRAAVPPHFGATAAASSPPSFSIPSEPHLLSQKVESTNAARKRREHGNKARGGEEVPMAALRYVAAEGQFVALAQVRAQHRKSLCLVRCDKEARIVLADHRQLICLDDGKGKALERRLAAPAAAAIVLERLGPRRALHRCPIGAKNSGKRDEHLCAGEALKNSHNSAWGERTTIRGGSEELYVRLSRQCQRAVSRCQEIKDGL